MDIGNALVRAQGISWEKADAIKNYKGSEVFSELERAVLEYAELLSRTPAHVPQSLFDRLRQDLNKRQLVELTNAIAWENYRARFNRGFDVKSDELA